MATSSTRIEIPLTISTSQYSAGDVVGGLISIDVSALPYGSILNAITIVDDDNEKCPLDFRFLNAAPTSIADNAAYAPTVSDLKKRITKVSFASTDYETVNGNAIAEKTQINHVVQGSRGTLYLYITVPTGSTPTYAATTDLWIALDFLPIPVA